ATVEVGHAKNVEMGVDVTSDALGSIVTDRHRLRQILVNLVANAVKFTEAGSVTIKLRTRGAPDHREWTIDVTDTGIGIAADRNAHLFEPFEQGDASIRTSFGGHGLGLALSRKIAEHLGGTLILARSKPGEGSTFRLSLTALPAKASEDTSAAS